MLDVLVAEVALQGAGVMPLVGKRVPAGVRQHVLVRIEAQLGLLPARLRQFELLVLGMARGGHECLHLRISVS